VARIVGLLSAGMVATLLFTAKVATAIRAAVKTPVLPVPKAKVGDDPCFSPLRV
jgi:hypothetical protein